MTKITCLVTLHGIGFQTPPQKGVKNSGYADSLHQHLKKCLGPLLSDDPSVQRSRDKPGENGAIYVESCWRDAATGVVSAENGLRRLGSWTTLPFCIDRARAPLVAHNALVSHIALVYSNLEPPPRSLYSTASTFEMTLLSLWRYATPLGLAHMVYSDLQALRRPPSQTQESPLSSRPRDGSDSVFLNLKTDVACYVCDNEQRERVRSFVAEALTRLACREDVEHIILNTHSNGTVIAFDVLRRLPAEVTCKIKAFVTAGSPLRKYVKLFSWGNEVESRYAFANWLNVLDPCDPVADPLALPPSWRVGQRPSFSRQTLFHRLDLDYGTPMPIHIVDCPVNNVAWSAGRGLRAHNYWDNQQEFIPQLAHIVRSVVNGTPVRLCS